MSYCWLCDQPVEDPPQIIGQWNAMASRVAHRRCLLALGELDLDLRADETGPAPSHEGAGPV